MLREKKIVNSTKKTPKKATRKITNKSSKNTQSDVVKRIAEETCYSVGHIRNVLAGRRNNAAIIKMAKRYTKKKR